MIAAIRHVIERIRWWNAADRLGPDCPTTQLPLLFPLFARSLCERKFGHFGPGAEFRPGAYAFSPSHIFLGANVVIRPGSVLSAGEGHIIIEDDVLIGPATHIYTANHEYHDMTRPIAAQGTMPGTTVTLKRGCWVGAGVMILPGITIGRNAVVGAGSVVTRDVPDFCVVAGNPARVLKNLAAEASQRNGGQPH